MHKWFVVFPILVLLVVGCRSWDPFWPQDVTFTFDNRTDLHLCEHRSEQEAFAAPCSGGLPPQEETKWGRDCDGDDDRPITVVINERESRDLIYRGTATCGGVA